MNRRRTLSLLFLGMAAVICIPLVLSRRGRLPSSSADRDSGTIANRGSADNKPLPPATLEDQRGETGSGTDRNELQRHIQELLWDSYFGRFLHCDGTRAYDLHPRYLELLGLLSSTRSRESARKMLLEIMRKCAMGESQEMGTNGRMDWTVAQIRTTMTAIACAILETGGDTADGEARRLILKLWIDLGTKAETGGERYLTFGLTYLTDAELGEIPPRMFEVFWDERSRGSFHDVVYEFLSRSSSRTLSALLRNLFAERGNVHHQEMIEYVPARIMINSTPLRTERTAMIGLLLEQTFAVRPSRAQMDHMRWAVRRIKEEHLTELVPSLEAIQRKVGGNPYWAETNGEIFLMLKALKSK